MLIQKNSITYVPDAPPFIHSFRVIRRTTCILFANIRNFRGNKAAQIAKQQT